MNKWITWRFWFRRYRIGLKILCFFFFYLLSFSFVCFVLLAWWDLRIFHSLLHSQRLWSSQWSQSRRFSGIVLLFSMIQWMLAIWSLILLLFLNSAWTSGSSQFNILLKPSLENFEHYFASMWDECNCVVVWAFFSIALLLHWNENWPFSPVATAEFSKFTGILSAALSQYHLLGFEIAELEFHHLHLRLS